MVLMALIALVAGVVFGLVGSDYKVVDFITENTNYVLYCLMFLVGISIGLYKDIVEKLKGYKLEVITIPLGIVVGSIVGGVVCSFFTKLPLNESTAIASGLGWYSLSAVMMNELAGATIGSIAFLSNLMREIFSFMAIPWIARHLNFVTCIAPAGATSEDTTLPMMMKYTNKETVVLSVLNGIICSALVPVLIKLCFKFF